MAVDVDADRVNICSTLGWRAVHLCDSTPPGMGAYTPESVMYGRFHRSEAPKVAHFWFTNVHDVGRTHEATFD